MKNITQTTLASPAANPHFPKTEGRPAEKNLAHFWL
jgi:hypothetical protein